MNGLPEDCAAVIARARAQHLLELLTRGPVEAAAVLLQTHPFVIDEIRERLASGALGASSDLPESDGGSKKATAL